MSVGISPTRVVDGSAKFASLWRITQNIGNRTSPESFINQMNSSPLVIIGAGGHARVVLDIARTLERPVSALVDDHKAITALDGVQVLDSIHKLADRPDSYEFVVAIGDNFVRAQTAVSLQAAIPQIRFAILCHPAATIARGSFLDMGTVVMAGAVVNPGSRIGKHCIVNTQASIDHDNIIGDYASLAPGSITGGNVRVGEYAVLCLGASVIHNITVGPHSIVAAGAVVLEDVPDYSIAIGVPARISRKRDAGDPYL